MNLHNTRDLTPDERLSRIAELLNKGIYLLAVKEGWFEEQKLKRCWKPKGKNTKGCVNK